MTEFLIDRRDLSDAVSFASRALARSGPIATLTGLRLTHDGSTLTASAFDYDTFASASFGNEGPAFDLLVPGQTFLRYLAGLLGDSVTFDVDENRVGVTADNGRVELPRIPLEDYPSAPPAPKTLGTIDAEALTAALASVRDSIDPNAPQSQRKGFVLILTSPMVVAGIHSQRFAVREVAWTGAAERTAIVPVAALDGVKAFVGDVTLGCDDGRLGLSDGRRQVVARLIEAKPDNFLPMLNLPNVATRVTFDRAEMVAALRFLTLGDTRKEATGTLFFVVGTDSVGLALAGADVDAQTSVGAKVEGDPVEMGWKAENLLHGLAGTDAETVTLSIQTPRRAALISADDDKSFRYAAQPWMFTR